MNKVYKVVWCEKTQTMVAVSEFAKSKGKSSSKSQLSTHRVVLPHFRLAKIALALMSVFGWQAAMAGTVQTCVFDSNSTELICDDGSTISANNQAVTLFNDNSTYTNEPIAIGSVAPSQPSISTFGATPQPAISTFAATPTISIESNKNPDNGVANVEIGADGTTAAKKGTKPSGAIAIGSKSKLENGVWISAQALGPDAVAIGTDSTADTQGIALGQADTGESGVAIGNDDMDAVAKGSHGKPKWNSSFTKVGSASDFSGFEFDASTQNFGNNKGQNYNIKVYDTVEKAEEDRENWVKTVLGRKDGD